MGIEALAAVLLKNGIEFRLFDRETDSMDTVASQIVEYGPSLLGLSVLMEGNAHDAAKILLKVRKKLDVPCVVGGLFVTTSYGNARAIFPKDCMLVVGEGETALLRICSGITGDLYPDMEKPHLAPDQWPWLYRHNLQDYLDMDAPISMKSSRGCPGQRRFCATPSLPDGLNRWSGRKIADVADEIEHLSKLYYPPAFCFVDDDFGPLSRLEALVDELEKRNTRCALSLQLRANTIYNTPDYERVMRKLKERGLYYIFIGIESFDEKTLEYFNKRLDPFKALKAAQTIRDCGIAVTVGYILWHPLSTVGSVRNEAIILRDAGFLTTKTCLSKLIMFKGCKLQKEPEIKYPDAVQNYYNAAESAIAPLYDAWFAGALDLPKHHCLAYLEPGSSALRNIAAIEKELERLDALAFNALMDHAAVGDAANAAAGEFYRAAAGEAANAAAGEFYRAAAGDAANTAAGEFYRAAAGDAANAAAGEIVNAAAAAKGRFHEISCAFVRSR